MAVENQEQQNYEYDFYSDVSVRLRDIEERQKIMKDRILLIGQNLIDFKEQKNEEIIEIKKDLEIIKMEMKRVKDFIENISNEFSNLARRSEIEILQKQAKMFQPLNLVTKNEVKKLVDEEIKKKRI